MLFDPGESFDEVILFGNGILLDCSGKKKFIEEFNNKKLSAAKWDLFNSPEGKELELTRNGETHLYELDYIKIKDVERLSVVVNVEANKVKEYSVLPSGL